MSNKTDDTATGAASTLSLPITFRLPARGHDPYFGLSRAWYYQAEKAGMLSMIRLRTKGRARGVTLIRTTDVLNLLGKEANR